ncbi:MAG: DUF3179 domain-containing protein [Halobacteriales archaeon]
MKRVSRRAFLAAAGSGALAGCFGGTASDPTPDSGTAPPATPTREADPTKTSRDVRTATVSTRERGATATEPARWPPTAEETLLFSRSPEEFRRKAVSAGPGKDGIPSIETPQFVAPDEAGAFLGPDDVVFGVERGGEVKAYPRKVMVWHEICNDRIAGDAVSVTYCPLTGTAMGFERGTVRFGVSGRLINNNLVMYDRATETWWPQMLATAIPGPWNRRPATASLREFRVVWTTWKRWRERHPDTRVLSDRTGYVRNYGRDPYNGSYTPKSGYYAAGGPLYQGLAEDDRFGPKEVVLGARTPEGAVAFHEGTLREATLMEGSLAGTPVLATYDPGLDAGYVYRNPREVSYEFTDGEVVGPDGEAHAPDALPLERIHAYDAMWFAWVGFYPDSNVYS